MSKFKVAILISGGGSNLQAIIDKFQSDENIELSCVLSNKKDAYGLKRASKANIDNFFVDHTNYPSREDFDRELIGTLEKYKPDLVVLAGFMRILSPLFVNKYLGKLINIHPSLLPKYKGLDTHKRVLENNEEYHGVTVHFVDNTLDGGPICAQSCLKVETKDMNELQRAIHKLEHELYPWVIDQIANKKIILSDGEIVKKA
ncbi:phosphoribosylglycinamide formyltransferase [SAR86 cluster bacterium]|nr:phosphoribosylglycinamide formyltransferase [SAR86 cluster bacterium]